MNPIRALLVGGLIAALCLGGLSPAQALADFSLRGHDLEVTVTETWIGGGEGGYFPIRIRVQNRGPARNLTFRFRSEYETMPIVFRTISVPQNATARITLPVPLVCDGTYGTFDILQDGQALRDMSNSVSLPDINYYAQPPSLLVISDGKPDLEAYERGLASFQVQHELLSRYSNSDHNSEVLPTASLPTGAWIDYSTVDMVAISLDTLAALPAEQRSALRQWAAAGGNLIVHGVGKAAYESARLIELLQLPERASHAAAWTPADPTGQVHVLLVDIDGGYGYGGYGAGYGSGYGSGGYDAAGYGETLVEEEAVKTGGQKPEPEDEDKEDFVWLAAAETFATYPLMFGTVTVFREDPFPGSRHDWAWLLNTLDVERLQWAARHGMAPRKYSFEFLRFLIPGVQGAPVLAFLVLISLFSIVIGPVNYLVLWRYRRLDLLVLTIPVIALVTCGALFGYSIVAHGLGVKSRVQSLTWIDQQQRTSVSASRIALYAGMAPSEGLTFSPDAAVYPIWPIPDSFTGGTVDWTEAQSLRSGWLRSRTRTQFFTIEQRDERGRLELGTATAEGLPVSNGFEWDLEALVVTDDNGKLFVTQTLPAGSRVALAPADPESLGAFVALLNRHPLELPDGVAGGSLSGMFSYRYLFDIDEGPLTGDSMLERQLSDLRMLATRPLPPRTYVAVAAENPGINLGMSGTEERASLHVIRGSY